MRPRKRDRHLPVGVYCRRGVHYRVVRGVWYRLGDDPNAPLPDGRLPAERQDILNFTVRALSRARQNAKGRGIAFSLAADDARTMLERAGWRCHVTGVPFAFEVIAGKRPFAPSIDRVDSRGGYTLANCRVVCVAANYAMNVWGESVLRRMLRSIGHVQNVGQSA